MRQLPRVRPVPDRRCFHHRLPAAGTLAVVLGFVTGCSEEDRQPFSAEREPPGDFYVAEASSRAVHLRWSHSGGGVTGFEVRRWIGSTASEPDAYPVAADVREFLDAEPDSEAILIYDVTAAYGEFRSNPTRRAVLSLDFLTPLHVAAGLHDTADLDDSVAVEWLPPDFESFDGFRIDRVLVASGEEVLDARFAVDHTTSLGAHFGDRDLPVGSALLDRLRYLVSLRHNDVFSAPVLADPEFQWSYPTLPEGAISSPLPPHVEAETRHFPESGLLTVSVVREDGAPEVVAFETDDTGRARSVFFSIAHPDGRSSGTVPDGNHVVVAHQAAGATDVVFQTFELPSDVSDPPVWSSTLSGALVGVWNAPDPGAIALVTGNSARVLDPATGVELNRIDYAAPIASIAFPSSDRLVAVEETRGSLRVSLRGYPEGDPFWTRDVGAGSLLSPAAGIVVSSSSAWLALSFADETMQVLATASGAGSGTAPGRALAFATDDAQLIGLEAVPGPLTAYRLGGGLLTEEDRFGSLTTTSGYVLPGGRHLTTIDAVGWLYQWTLSRRWTPPLNAIARLGPAWVLEKAGVPVAPLPDLRRGRRTG